MDESKAPAKRGRIGPWIGLFGSAIAGIGFFVAAIISGFRHEPAMVGFFFGMVLLSWVLTVLIFRHYRSPIVEAHPLPAEPSKPKRRIGGPILIFVILGSVYLAYVLGWLNAAKAAIVGGSEVLTSKILESKVEVTGQSMGAEYMNFFDYALVGHAKVRNKTASTVRVWVKAEVLSQDGKVVLERMESALAGPKGTASLRIVFLEAEQKDEAYYRSFRILVDRIE